MKLYNTLGHQKSNLRVPSSSPITLYTCGPTVYDYAHIGNLRKFIFDDLLRRALQANGYKVAHVMNITDVGHLVSDGDEGEDKLEKGALREQKSVWQVAEHYTTAFKSDAAALNILRPNGYNSRPDGYARATDFIDQQIEMVKTLLAKGFAYQTTQAIYFDVTKLPDYGKLTGQSLEDKEIGVRSTVITDADKHHPYDFAVWFFTVGHFKDHSMHWPTPWGQGFPGWHLECSAIIHQTLGEPLDIHTGGIDHIGTHHTNEIAQSEAAFDHPLADFWLHSEFIKVDGQKMSKSKNNFYTLKDITDRIYDEDTIKQHHYSPLAYRLLVLQAHYRSELNFSWTSLTSAQRRLHNLYMMADLYNKLPDGPPSSEFKTFLNHSLNSFMAAIADDLNTPQAFAELSKLEDRMAVSQNFGGQKKLFKQVIDQIETVLGLGIRVDVYGTLSDKQNQMLSDREIARKSKNFKASDELRNALLKEGIAVEDTPNGPRWHRTNP